VHLQPARCLYRNYRTIALDMTLCPLDTIGQTAMSGIVGGM